MRRAKLVSMSINCNRFTIDFFNCKKKMVYDCTYRNELVESIESERARYFQTNALRNPFKDMEMYIVPLIIASISWICAFFVDKTCSTDICEVNKHIIL